MLLSGAAPAIAATASTPPRSGAAATYTNRLAGSHNPYLLLHAHNPVQWYPWGEEALAQAKAENKPIFVSVGYSTCYWCHVAERTLYSDPAIAALMNRWFINIKVDREQRPDLDRILMLARQMLTGAGGWPNNVFLTPNLEAFYAGSYFPREDDPARGPGFARLLRAVHRAWTSDRGRIIAIAQKVHRTLQRLQAIERPLAASSSTAAQWLDEAAAALVRQLDPAFGGFRLAAGPAKFPRAPSLEVLLLKYRLSADASVLHALVSTLDAMAMGGIHDHLGGGFHRYSTRRDWSIPHFEKMLYDNAQLLGVYARAFALTGNGLYARAARGIGGFLLRDMMAPAGGFFTAIDAEVDGVEGASYLWTREAIRSLLGPARTRDFLALYRLTAMPEGLAIHGEGGALRIRRTAATTPRGLTDRLAALDDSRALLLAARGRRHQPMRDEKILVDFNGLAIQSLARAGTVLGEPRYAEAAERAAERIWKLGFDPEQGTLRHEIVDGRSQTAGFPRDYAELGLALLDLHARADGHPSGEKWRRRAARLADSLLARFARDDGSFASTPFASELPLVLPEMGDGDYPSGTSAVLAFLLRMGDSPAGDTSAYAAAALRAAKHLAGRVQRAPQQWPASVVAANAWGGTVLGGPAALARPQPLQTSDRVSAAAVIRSADAHDVLLVTIQVAEGFHINANPASLDYLVATEVELDGPRPVEIRYPAPSRFEPAFAPDGLDVYEGSTEIVVLLPAGARAGATGVSGTLTAQACDERICLPPSRLPLRVDRPVR